MKAVKDLEYHTHVSPSLPTSPSFLMNKYHILTHTHTYGIQREGTDEPISRGSNGEADIENRLMDMGKGEDGEDEMNGERSMEAYALSYIKQIANGNLLYDSGNSNWGSVTTQRAGEGWKVGGRSNDLINHLIKNK